MLISREVWQNALLLSRDANSIIKQMPLMALHRVVENKKI
jgi:hypothetical protein